MDSVSYTHLKEMQLDDKVYRLGMVQSRISNAKNSLITYTAYEQNKELVEDVYKRQCLGPLSRMEIRDWYRRNIIVFRRHTVITERN